MKHSKSQIGRLRVGIEYPRRRFGIVAIEKGFITVDQLWEALIKQEHQNQDTEERMHIGEILKKMGYMADSELNEVLDLMEQEEALREHFSKGVEVHKSAVKAKKAV